LGKEKHFKRKTPQMRALQSNWVKNGILWSAALFLYLYFAGSAIEAPGLYYDEVLFANAALGNLDGSFVAWGIPWGDHKIPLMLMGYIGALKAYLYAPLFAWLGTSVAVVRWPMILAGIGTLLLTWKLAWRMFGEKVAWTVLFLTAADPSFIMNHRLDWGPVALGLLFKAGSLYGVWRWLEQGEARYLWGAALLMGLGLYDKAIFVWYLLGLFLALLVVYPRQVWQQFRFRQWLLASGAFLLAALPFVFYNLKGPLRSFRQSGLVNTSPWSSWESRWSLLKNTLEGAAAYWNIEQRELSQFWALPDSPAQNWVGGLLELLRPLHPSGSLLSWFLGGALLVLGLLLLSRKLEKRKELLFLLILLAGMYGASYLSLARTTGQHHVVPLYPLPHLVVAVALWSLGCFYPVNPGENRALLLGAVPLGLAGVLLLSQVTVDAIYLESFRKLGGAGLWSEAIEELAAWAQKNPQRELLLMDWGFSNQLLLRGRGKIRQAEYFVPIERARTPAQERSEFLPWVRRPGCWLVFHDPSCQTMESLAAFERVLAQEGLRRRLVREFDDRQGRPVYWVYEVEHPAWEADRGVGKAWLLREAEEWTQKQGGGLEFPLAASMRRALGRRWGTQAGDWAEYEFHLEAGLKNTEFRLRYLASGGSQRLRVRLNGALRGEILVGGGGGNGEQAVQWVTGRLGLGVVPAGPNCLRLEAVTAAAAMRLDCWSLTAPEAPPLW
jgi:4-amino-4-deoxy-L-arabinose transferase-like glycosyltransferase